MSKKSKLEEFNLIDEARQLREAGHGLIEIKNILNMRHPEITGGVSHMAVKRGLEIENQNDIHQAVIEGRNPVDEFSKELKEKVDENTKSLFELKTTADKILEEAMESDSISDKTKALKEVRETLAQVVKNMVILQQYCNRQTDNLDREAFKQKEQVKVLLVKWISIIEENVCPICKEKTIPKIISLVESEGE